MSGLTSRLVENRFVIKAQEALYGAIGHYPVTIAGKRFKCDPHHLDFWRRASRGSWEPDTYRILDKFLRPDSIYVDIGAWIGPTVIFAATISKQVFCFEPDYFAYKYLLWNIQLNDLRNVVPANLAIAHRNGIMKMASIGELGDSMTSLLVEGAVSEEIEVSCMEWSNWLSIAGPEHVDFIKIDIEGAEFDLLPKMKGYLMDKKPIVYLALHAPRLKEEKRRQGLNRIIEVLSGYRKCLNQKLEPMSIESLADPEWQRWASGFRSVLFMD